MDKKLIKLVFFGFAFLTICGTALSEYCREEYACTKTCEFTLLKIFEINWSFKYSCGGTCTRQACCTGYTGDDCSQLTDECVQQDKCLGHKEEVEYTDYTCTQEVAMSEGQTFMGSNKRKVRVKCDSPSTRTECSPGFTGPDCNEKVENNPLSLTEAQLESIKEQLKVDEGYKDEIYNDSLGYPTFGIGHHIDDINEPMYGKPVGTKVSEYLINQAFKADVHIAEKTVLVIFPDAATFPGEVKEILVNMAFNMGQSRLKTFKKFIAAVNRSDWDRAADEMVDSDWYKQVKSRAVRLVDRMRAVSITDG